jgi:NAD(P)-dependent dehydrogenase (short-subunit alcohol dehydrogenase family)
VVSGRREEQGAAVVAAIKHAATAGGDAVFVKADVSNPDDVELLFARAKEAFGGVDSVLVNAGVVAWGDYLGEDGNAQIAKLVNINTLGATYTVRSAVLALKERGGGSIILTSSSAAAGGADLVKSQGSASLLQVYAATKSYVDALARNLYAEQEASGIRTYSLAPSVYASEMAPAESDAVAGLAGAVHKFHKTLGDPRHLAEVVEHLVAGTSKWVPGSLVTAEGPYTYDGRVSYEQVYDPKTFTIIPGTVTLDHLRDAQGNPLTLTEEEVAQASDAAVAERNSRPKSAE